MDPRPAAGIASIGASVIGGAMPIEVRNFDAPDERRRFEEKGVADFVTVAGRAVGRGIFEPGWKWSVDVKPFAGTESCQFSHLSYVVSGRMRILMDDGSEASVGPGDVVGIPPGHDAEVIGDEPCVMVDLVDVEAGGDVPR
jgi:hypothetical protein